MPTPRDNTYIEDHRRVAKALLQALDKLPAGADAALLADLEAFCFGWAALPACTDLLHRWDSSAAASAMQIGRKMAKRRIAAAEDAAWQEIDEADKRQRSSDEAKTSQPKDDPASDARMKEFKATIRCIPLVDEYDGPGKCIVTGEQVDRRVVIAKAY